MFSGTRGKSSGWSLPLQWTEGGHAQQPYHSAAPQHLQPHSRTSAVALIPGEKGFFSCIFSIEAFSCQKPAPGVVVVGGAGPRVPRGAATQRPLAFRHISCRGEILEVLGSPIVPDPGDALTLC